MKAWYESDKYTHMYAAIYARAHHHLNPHLPYASTSSRHQCRHRCSCPSHFDTTHFVDETVTREARWCSADSDCYPHWEG